MVLDTLGMFAAAAGLPEQVERAAGLGPRRSAGCRPHDDIGNVVGAGHGRQRHGRRRGAGGGRAVHAGARRRAQGLRAAQLRRPRHARCWRCRSRATPRRRSRPPPGRGRGGRPRGRASQPGRRLGRLAAEWGAPLIPVRPRPSPCPGPGIGAVVVPPLVRARAASGCSRGRRPWIDSAVEPAPAAARPAGGPGQPRRGAGPAASAGRMPLVYGGGGVGAAAAVRWKSQFNENAKVPPSCNQLARAVPQRDLRLGPARRRHPPGLPPGDCSATTSSTPSVGRRFELRRRRPSTRSSPASTRSRPRARVRWPSCSTWSCSATS